MFDLCTSLLVRLEGMHAEGCRLGPKDCPPCHQHVWSVQDEKAVANIEHLFRCLQQDALNALVQHVLRIVDADRDHWGRYWQQIEQLDDGWFAEWPNGRRPLSTTWPWNIKPSLVILWGVCWMFIYAERDTQYAAGRGRSGGRPQGGNSVHAQAQAPCKFDQADSLCSTGIRLQTEGFLAKTAYQTAKISRLRLDILRTTAAPRWTGRQPQSGCPACRPLLPRRECHRPQAPCRQD